MLIRFEVSNFRSMRHSAELTMVAIDRNRPAARNVPALGESLLPVAAIYGPNASGKSNLLAAFAWLRYAVRDSLRTWDDTIPVEPFAFADGPAHPTEFAVELMVGDVRFEYVLELDQRKVHYEGLFHYPERKRRRIFERQDDELKFQRGLGVLSGTRDLMTERTLALSVARRFDEPLVSGFARRLLDTQTMARPQRGKGHFLISNATLLRLGEPSAPDQPTLFGPGETARKGRAEALALLRMADLGIDDVLIEKGMIEYPGQRRVRLIHRSGDERLPFDLSDESDGTRTWLDLIDPVLTALESGSLLLFDELDASLHPTLSLQLVRLFHDPTTNPMGAQLVFTSHDTSLLNHLNRDEVWLTEKSDDGVTRLGALSDFAGERVRRSQNIERAYLHGRFGALPNVDRTEILRTLGLIG